MKPKTFISELQWQANIASFAYFFFFGMLLINKRVVLQNCLIHARLTHWNQ